MCSQASGERCLSNSSGMSAPAARRVVTACSRYTAFQNTIAATTRFNPPAAQALAEAAVSLGHAWCEDINAPGATGTYAATLNVRNGARVTTNDAYLEPARDRLDLQIVGSALVEAVEFDGPRAVAVRGRVGGAPVRWEAGEVLLCAGAIHSPAILLHSGIGRADALRALGITPKVDLPDGLDRAPPDRRPIGGNARPPGGLAST